MFVVVFMIVLVVVLVIMLVRTAAHGFLLQGHAALGAFTRFVRFHFALLHRADINRFGFMLF